MNRHRVSQCSGSSFPKSSENNFRVAAPQLPLLRIIHIIAQLCPVTPISTINNFMYIPLYLRMLPIGQDSVPSLNNSQVSHYNGCRLQTATFQEHFRVISELSNPCFSRLNQQFCTSRKQILVTPNQFQVHSRKPPTHVLCMFR